MIKNKVYRCFMLRSSLEFLARALISLIFIFAAFQKLVDWQGSEQFLTQVLTDWHSMSTDVLIFTLFLLEFAQQKQLLGCSKIVFSQFVNDNVCWIFQRWLFGGGILPL